MRITNKVLMSVDESDLKDGVFYNKSVTEISDNCFYNIRGLIEINCPKVKKIGNNALSSNASLTTVSLPVCTQIGDGALRCNASLTTVSLPVCTQIGDGALSYNASLTTVSLPVCTQIGSYALRSNASLTTVSLPVCTQIGSYALSANDKLTTVSLPVCTQIGNDALSYNDKLTTLKIGNKTYHVKNIDSSCFVIESEKTTKGIKIYTGYNFLSMADNVIEKQSCLVAEKGGFTAHGDTVKKAIQDLQFKIVAETLKKAPINKDTPITIQHYRLITGSCELGVKLWMKQHPEAYEGITAGDLFPILKKSGAYGFETFESLITFKP